MKLILHEATLPISKIKIEFCEPTPGIIKEARRLSIRKVVGGEDFDAEEFGFNILRYCIKKINNQSCDYSKLMGDQLFELIQLKELTLIINYLTSCITPSPDENEDFLGSIRPVES